MIRTDIDIKDFVYGVIRDSILDRETTGSIYKDLRPLNSCKEDIVISVLARDASVSQYSIVNVNIYVPDLKKGKDFVEDIPRLRELCRESANLLEYGSSNGCFYQLNSQEVIRLEGIGWHCINNKVLIKFNNE